ncbi:MAG: CocE/NonD family hydrolase [Nannocystaceae bacterium]|nr:CocE/NonD family hydrolase [Nannocystaceae bacterium]
MFKFSRHGLFLRPSASLLAAACMALTACSSDDTGGEAQDESSGSESSTGGGSSGGSSGVEASTTAAAEATGDASSTGVGGEQPIELPDGTEMIFDQGEWVPMRDGANLSANIFRPAEPGQYPILMAITPYDKDILPWEYEEEDGDIEVSQWAGFEMPDPAFWVPRGYVVVAVDSRGQGLSEGDMALLTDQEAEDYYDAIEWLAQREWSNGKVGLNGVSYMAINQWKVAQLEPPHLAAIMPYEGFTDLYRDFAYHGGIGGSAFFGGWWEQRILPAKSPESVEQPLLQEVEDNPLFGPFYESLMPTALYTVDVPAYVATSWQDHGLHTRGTIRGFEALGSEQKWLEVHGRKKWEWYYSAQALERQAQFFDRFLLDEDNGMDDVPTVLYEVREAAYEGEMRTSDQWPLESELTALSLDASTMTLTGQAPDAPGTVRYAVADGDSEFVHFSHTVEENTTITGSMNLHLWVAVEGADDTDVFVGIRKFDASGEEVIMLSGDSEVGQVANGWLRASHRNLDVSRSSATRPFHPHDESVPLPSAEPVELQIELWPSSTLFEAGERLDVVIGGADQEHSGQLHFGSVPEGTVDILTGPDYASELVFPVIAGG